MILELAGVSRHFGGVAAVDGVDLAVGEGELLGLIGPNGAGKTTLLDIVSGLQSATGRIHFRGADISAWPVHRRAARGMARTFQTPRLFTGLTVGENVAAGLRALEGDDSLACTLGLRTVRRRRRERCDRVRDLLSRVGLEGRQGELAGALTPGDRRCLELAGALAMEPVLLLLDEPAAGMGADELERLIALLEDLRGAGLAVVLIEHHLPLVMETCDRVVVLDFGRVIGEGSPGEVMEQPAVVDAYLGSR